MNKQSKSFYTNAFQTKLRSKIQPIFNCSIILSYVFVMFSIKNTELEIMFANIRV